MVSTEGGGYQMSFEALRALVRGHPELTVAAAQAYAAISGEGNYGQVARALAVAYQVEFGDDNLALEVEDALTRAGSTSAPPRTLVPGRPPDSSDDKPVPVQLNIGGDLLSNADAYGVVTSLSPQRNPDDHQRLRQLRGRVLLTFDVGDDPREVYEIPAVRAFLADLAARLPGFAYYLDPNPEVGMFLVWFGGLADSEALVAPSVLDMWHDSVLAVVGWTLLGVRELATSLGENPEAACRDVLSFATDEYVDQVLAALPS